MDREDKRRYFIVGSVILEVVTPLFRQKLENKYSSQGLGSLQAFLNQQPVIHTLFHLRHRNVWCCTDRPNCVSNPSLPLIYCQWNLLYSENPGPGRHHCHCKYSANAVQLEDLDITLAGLILLNCCNLGPIEENAIKILRQFKNDYLSHNTKGSITQAEYNTLWADLNTYVLQLDPSKEDDLVRIENRPLDEALCKKYFTCLLDLHKKLDEIDSSIQSLHTSVHTIDTSIQDFIQVNQGQHTTVQNTLQELLFYAKRGASCQCNGINHIMQGNLIQPYKLGENIFKLHEQMKLARFVSGGVIMDDGRLVLCLFNERRLHIFYTDGSEEDSIAIQGYPQDVTAVNNTTVAVTLPLSKCIEVYDIHNKHKLKSISVPSMCSSITTINNKLVVGCDDEIILMIDHQTGEVVQTIQTNCAPVNIHAVADKIWYSGAKVVYNIYISFVCPDDLYCYNFTEGKTTTTMLPSIPRSITSLQDGSLYVACENGSVQHVSADGQHYKPVKTKGLNNVFLISYDPNQQLLMAFDPLEKSMKIFKKV